jgi:hypothetical protein
MKEEKKKMVKKMRIREEEAAPCVYSSRQCSIGFLFCLLWQHGISNINNVE